MRVRSVDDERRVCNLVLLEEKQLSTRALADLQVSRVHRSSRYTRPTWPRAALAVLCAQKSGNDDQQ